DENALLAGMKQVIQSIRTVEGYFSQLSEPLKRLDGSYLELKDIVGELRNILDHVEADPSRLQVIQDRLDLLYTLEQKHQVPDQDGLIALREELDLQLAGIQLSSDNIEILKKETDNLNSRLIKEGEALSSERIKGIPEFCTRVEASLSELGMPNARFEIGHDILEIPGFDGLDKMSFLFAANKNQKPETVSKIASGGEISRLMLSIKGLISSSLDVDTLIFDEIDAGVSGEIADKMGKMIKSISKGRQVFNITHLPQVASSGDQHYLVYKYDDDLSTHTAIKLLNREERILQLARMLSGEEVTDEAVNNARQLLN
ncbi:MAG: DNA repair protein RecN, partial [Bacteroidota bacterium]|nr:DNA repair protein RecN [Bacteroidota bacterium]